MHLDYLGSLSLSLLSVDELIVAPEFVLFCIFRFLFGLRLLFDF